MKLDNGAHSSQSRVMLCREVEVSRYSAENNCSPSCSIRKSSRFLCFRM